MASLAELLAGILGGTTQVPPRVADAVTGAAPAYDPMSGALIGGDTERTAPEAAPNRYARATLQSIGGIPKAALWDMPRDAVEAARNAPLPGDRTTDYSETVAPIAGAAMSIAGARLPWAKSGEVGVFGGRLAKTADTAALAEAETMAASGADRQAIWDKTGWFKGADEKWRFEIPDNKAVMNPTTYGRGEMPNRGEFGTIAGQLWHKPLYEAYPDLRRAEALIEKDTLGGSYQTAEHAPSGRETIKVQAKTVPEARSVMLHEAQHGIQEREGFAGGGSPRYFSQADEAALARDALSYRREIAKLDPSMTPKQKDDIIRKQYEEIGAPEWFPSQGARDVAHDLEGNPAKTLDRIVRLYGLDQTTTPFSPRRLYHELPGEVEARNVEKRRDMTSAERRATPPWMTEDITPRPVMNEIFGTGRVGSLESGRQMAESAPRAYPVAPRGEWYGDANFAQTGGKMVTMTPDEFLAKGRPMKVDAVARENIDDLKAHMLSGKTLDPLAIYKNGKEDGRHRAIAAKELGISEVPVLVWGK